MEDLREKIISAASVLLERYGYRKMTIDDIAGEVGVSHTTIYKYFRGKDEIIAQIAKREAQETEEAIEKIITEKISGIEKLYKSVNFLTNRILDKKNLYQITTSDLLHLFPIIEDIINNEEEKMKNHLRKIFTQIKKEHNAHFDPTELAESVFFILSGITNALIMRNFDKTQVIRYLENFFNAFEELEKGECQ